jgi:succinyl-diaminopimelate desuccinylase
MGTDEESGSSDISYYFAHQPTPPYTFSPDGTFPVINTEKGNFKPTFSRQWTASKALPRITAIKGGYRINVIPPRAEAWVEGLTPADIQPYCNSAAETTGAEYTLSEEDGQVKILAVGKGEHASTPEKGNNAITALLTLLAALPMADSESFKAVQDLTHLFPHGDYYGKALGIAQSDAISGPLTVSFNIFEQTLTGFEGRIDSRTSLSATRENCLNVAADRFAGLGIHMEGVLSPGHHTPADSPFVQTLLRTYEQYTGLKGACESTGGGTYVHDIEGGVAFGAILPGFEPKMHGADECVRISDLITASKIFTQVIIDLCS